MTGFPRRISEVPPRAWILLGLLALTFGIYGQTAWHPFINLDDESLIYGNPHVQSGLTWENILWAFTSTSGASFWHPLTWLSHMVDVELFGMNAGGHHLMSAGIHALNAMVLFLVLARMTGSTWRSAFVAALFAVHPLHVESVAWAAERKDVLSALFFLLSLWAYTRYAERPGGGRYGLVALCFALSLMSKPMAVTLPFVLLLLDYWPLRRIKGMAPEGSGDIGKSPTVQTSRILWEKIPLLVMAAGSLIMTLGYERGTGSSWLVSLENYSLWVRSANAVVSYGLYLWKTVWPVDLAVFYPHPGREIAMWKVGVSGLFLSVATVLAVRFGKRRPYLPVGWFFFLGTLIPVVGLVQVGSQAMADRYTYIPLIGIFLLTAWAVPEFLLNWRPASRLLWIPGCAVVGALAVTAWGDVGFWQDSVSLHSRAAAVVEWNWLALNNLGALSLKSGRALEAERYLKESVRIRPDYVEAWSNLAMAYNELDYPKLAVEAAKESVKRKPDFAEAWLNMGVAYVKMDHLREAIACYREALRYKPGLVEAWYNLGAVYSFLGQPLEAIPYYRETVRLKPDFANAWMNMGAAYEKIGNQRDADACYQEARRLNTK